MQADVFSASARRVGDKGIIDLGGDITRASEEDLNAAYDRLAGEVSSIVLNFESVSYINSTGIAVIVGLLAKARTQNRTVTAYGLSNHYREIFQITRLSDFVTIFDDETKALSGTTF